MRRIVPKLCMAAILVFALGLAQAQDCTVAEMISPEDGSVLDVWENTFTWCDARADYFLSIETLRGAHDVVFAVFRGITSITFGVECASTPPSGCILPYGETVYVDLWTHIRGRWQPPFHYEYTAGVLEGGASLSPPSTDLGSLPAPDRQ